MAGFLGVSNLLPARRDGGSNGYATFRLSDGSPVRVSAGIVEGQPEKLAIGVRPEKIRMSETGTELASQLNHLSGVIADASYLGVSTQYIVELPGGHRVTVYEQNVERATKSELWTRGEAVQLAWLPEHSFVVAGDSAADPATEDAP